MLFICVLYKDVNIVIQVNNVSVLFCYSIDMYVV